MLGLKLIHVVHKRGPRTLRCQNGRFIVTRRPQPSHPFQITAILTLSITYRWNLSLVNLKRVAVIWHVWLKWYDRVPLVPIIGTLFQQISDSRRGLSRRPGSPLTKQPASKQLLWLGYHYQFSCDRNGCEGNITYLMSLYRLFYFCDLHMTSPNNEN